MYKNLISLISASNKSKYKFLLLIFLLVISSIIETIGLALVIPLITAIVDYENISNMPKIYFILEFVYKFNFLSFDLNKQQELIILITLFIIFFFILKFVFLLFVAWFQHSFLVHFQSSLTSLILKNYMHLNYSFHVKKNSSELISIISEEANEASNAVKALILVLADFLLLLGITTLLFLVVKIWALYAGVSILLFAILIKSWGFKKLLSLGKARQFHYQSRLEALKNIFGAIKEIKILSKESFFLDKFNFHNFSLNSTAVPKAVINALPRLTLEFFGVLVILVLTIIWVINDIPPKQIIYFIGLMAVCAFRIFPSTAKIITSFQELKFKLDAVKKVSKSLTLLKHNKESQSKNSEKINFNSLITLQINEFSYSTDNPFKMSKIKIEILKNNFVGIFGPSGSGKSTLIDIFAGIIQMDNDKNYLQVDGKKINNTDKFWREKIGYIGQNIFLMNDKIINNVAFGEHEDQIDNEKVILSLKKAEIFDFISNLTNKEKTILDENGLNFSGGQRQRIGIARLFYLNPEILLFDEATSSLDKKVEEDLLKTIYKLKGLKTVIMVSHKTENLKDCDVIYEVMDGKIKKKN